MALVSLNNILERMFQTDSYKSNLGSKCNIYQISKPIASFQYAMSVEAFSPYMDVFNHKYDFFFTSLLQNFYYHKIISLMWMAQVTYVIIVQLIFTFYQQEVQRFHLANFYYFSAY